MKIYDRDGALNTARIHIVLAAKALDNKVEFERVDLIGAKQKTPEFLAKNPIGKVPLLELDDGTILSECTAITEYLDNLDGKPVPTGTTPREKGLRMQRRVEQLVMEPHDDYFHYGTRGLGPALTPWRIPEWEGRKKWGERRPIAPEFTRIASRQARVEQLPAVKNRTGKEILAEDLTRFTA
jgi:glutathione S-transferase